MNPKRLQIAARAKCPITAIPRPGQKPFILSRETLALTIAGAEFTNVEFLENDWLAIECHRPSARTPGSFIRSTTKMRAIPFGPAIVCQISDWVKTQRKKKSEPQKRAGKAAGKVRKVELEIAKVDRQISSLKYSLRTRPENPFCYVGKPHYDRDRDMLLTWRNEKPKRAALAKIQAAALQGDLRGAKLYAALKTAGFERVTVLTKVPTRNGHRPTLREYLLDLYKYVGLHQTRRDKSDTENVVKELAALQCERKEYIAVMREMVEAKLRKAALLEIIEGYSVKSEEPSIPTVEIGSWSVFLTAKYSGLRQNIRRPRLTELIPQSRERNEPCPKEPNNSAQAA